jgi:hypothetical protein
MRTSSLNLGRHPGLLWGAAFAAVFLVCGAWLAARGAHATRESLVRELAAGSFLSGRPLVFGVKHDYSLAGPILHLDARVRPGMPALLALGHALGIKSPALGAWLAAIFLAACAPIWGWALGPASGALVMALLLAGAGNGLWEELSSGGSAPAGIACLGLALGAARRGSFRVCGLAGMAGFLFHPGFETAFLALVLAHAAFGSASGPSAGRTRGRLIEAAWMAAPIFCVMLPFAVAGARPWLGRLAGSYLEGAGARERWFFDTDGGLGHPTSTQPTYVLFEEFIRNRWYDLTRPWLGDFLSELALPAPLLFGAFIHGLRRPAARVPLATFWLAAIGALLVGAGWLEGFERSQFLLVDALAAAWLSMLILDASPWARGGGIALACVLLAVNAGDLAGLARPAEPGLLDQDFGAVTTALRASNTEHGVVLARRGEGRVLALATPEIPFIELPENFADPGLLDGFIERWNVRWTTMGELLGPLMKKHRLDGPGVAGTARLWSIKPL